MFGRQGRDAFPALLDLREIASGAGGFVLRSELRADLAWRAAGIGDVNADGIDDFAVLITGAFASGERMGSATVVVYGQSEPFEADITLGDIERGTREGSFLTGTRTHDYEILDTMDVAPLGDVNGDGIDDFLIGDPANPSFPGDPGTAYVVFGRAGGLGDSLDLNTIAQTGRGVILQGVSGIEREDTGRLVRGLGDVNADGLPDLFIDSYDDSYVVYGGPTLTGTIRLGELSAEQGFARPSVQDGVGDVNGDGLDDFVARGTDALGIVYGRPSGLAGAPLDITFRPPAGAFVSSIVTAGDFDGDGIDDVLLNVVVSGDLSTREDDVLDAYVVLGRRGELSGEILLDQVGSAIPGFDIRNDLPDRLGTYAAIGDVSGDGYGDLGVDLPGFDAPDGTRPDAGGVYIVYGRPLTPTPQRGTAADDALTGTAADNAITGLDGDDLLRGLAGCDTLRGGAGQDTLDGGADADQLRLGAGDRATGGADRDGFLLLADAPGALITITDFARAEGDSLNFARIDADATTAGDQEFVWIGRARFSGTAGELRWDRPAGTTGRDSRLLGDTDGDGTADVAVLLAGVDGVRESWFVL